MTRAQLEHLIGGDATIADDTEVVVVGCRATPGQGPDRLADLGRVGGRACQTPFPQQAAIRAAPEVSHQSTGEGTA
jgi:hypothetical protein